MVDQRLAPGRVLLRVQQRNDLGFTQRDRGPDHVYDLGQQQRRCFLHHRHHRSGGPTDRPSVQLCKPHSDQGHPNVDGEPCCHRRFAFVMGDFTRPPKRAVIQHRHRRHRWHTFHAPNQRGSAHDLGQQHGRFGVLHVQPHGERRPTDQPHLRQHQPHPDGRHTGEHRPAVHGGWNRDLVVHRPVPPRRTNVQHLNGPNQRDPHSAVGHGRDLHRHGHEFRRFRLHDVQHGRVGHTAEFPLVFSQRHRADHRSNDDAQRSIGVGWCDHRMVDQR